ncbi:DEAD/DEAH box helicase [Ornithobacterium rhinotracheale]|uniref:DEAD/DEAH box helicase family protein n=1 Tax=Ornithobacterium rhinotracheale TaxID=28251 RepID=UPI00129C9869|nr:DEAD/DEAH box helicase family protein [Ornithobacterium rhinotracheale]MRJ09236.1 DEAD/DEAH box helicase [Ornithobacterium rhinotracheale]UOH78793.1 DEAD/DEAH box helicase family protein [Ornithobacterium rhinotracheale]
MRTNFTFLQKEFPQWYNEVCQAEQFTYTAPKYAALSCRIVLEKALYWLYQQDEDLNLPYDTKLSSLLFNDDFKTIVPPSMFRELDIVRRFGNYAAHGKRVRALEALQSLKNIFRFLAFVSKLYSQENPEIPVFDERVIPYGDEQDKTKKELQALAEANEKQQQENAVLLEKQKALEAENAKLKQEHQAILNKVSARKNERKTQFPDAESIVKPIVSEKDTRETLINLMLREAGWHNFEPGVDIEYKVKGMPLSTNPSGVGYVDYVLWGKNGKPLAIVEAKKTLYDASKGKHQAKLYANALEQQFGQRPIIFYTNGFNTYLWEDTFYPPRQVFGFYTQEELESLMHKRSERQDLRDFEVDRAIAGRPYQLEATQRVAENFVTTLNGELKGKHRKALLVMATGSGKTRTAASLVDMLIKCNWAKRILFLADRNALVTQAKNAFKDYLPQLSAIDLTKEKSDHSARLVFSTYPTILNRIDQLNETGERPFGIGHFDLIIIDEAHRSVYQKYQAIFEYFDGLLLGLTATPKKDVDRNTYQLFEIEDDNPTFAYEIEQAVREGYLVPPKAFSVPVKFPREGIKYKELSKKDQEELESLFGIAGTEHEDIDIAKSEINSFLFNKNTVDLVLEYLMKNGQKIESGDKLGKTIIFAKNHKHALFIEERFNKNYPEYSGNFLQVIDNYNDKAQDLLEAFCFDKGEEKDPQIAVSVDMMDTGVDAPRVLNLVFFKEVKSYAKFWQMIGRGTRLCPQIFGVGKDKEYFTIFDICGNLEFFDEHPEGVTSTPTEPLHQRLFKAQLEVVMAIRQAEHTDEVLQQVVELYTKQLHQKVMGLDEQRLEVKRELPFVKKYKDLNQWQDLEFGKVLEIQEHLSHLISYTEDTDELAKKLDLTIYKLQKAILSGDKNQKIQIESIMGVGKMLEKKSNIPSVKQKIETVQSIQKNDFWENVNMIDLERLRADLRHLMKLLKGENQKKEIFYTNLHDELMHDQVREVSILENYTTLQNYRTRVEDFIKKNRQHLVIDKLYRNIPITQDELKSLEEFLAHEQFNVEEIEKACEVPSLGVFVRKVLGLDIKAANEHFSEFIQNENLNANQIRFVQKIIDYLNKNGVLDKEMLGQSPFSDECDGGIFGMFEDSSAMKIIHLIDTINQNTGVA